MDGLPPVVVKTLPTQGLGEDDHRGHVEVDEEQAQGTLEDTIPP